MLQQQSWAFAALLLVAGAAVGCGDDSGGDTDLGMVDEDTSVVDDEDAVDDVMDDDTEGDALAADTFATDTSLADTGPLDEDTSAEDTTPEEDTAVPEGTTNGFDAAGLLVRIETPGGNGTATTTGGFVRVGGLLFGEADTLIWQANGESGEIPKAGFWGSSQIQLNAGDNLITVTASKGDLSVSDSVVVTYNPAFQFDDALNVRPGALWEGQSTQLSFTIPTSLYQNIDPTTIELLRVDKNGFEIPGEAGKAMFDNGETTSSGDEIEGDGVFTYRGNYSCSAGEALFFRASGQVEAATNYDALSAVVRVDCVQHLTTASCNSHKALIDSASSMLDGGSSAEDVASFLQADPSVKAAGVAESGGYSAWVQFNDGILGAVLGTPAGKRGAGDGQGVGLPSPSIAATTGLPQVGSKKALVLAPFASEFGDTEDGTDVASSIANSECPAYDLEGGTVLQGGNASLARLRTMSEYGIVSVSTHGEALFGGVDVSDMQEQYRWRHHGPQEVLWSGSAVACNQLLQSSQSCTITNSNPSGGCPQGSRCLVTEGAATDSSASGSGICMDETQVDLRLGRVAITNRGYAITPSFIDAYKGRGYPKSLVNLGACRTMYNGSLVSSLYAAGALAITGFTGHVESAWAKEQVVDFFTRIGQVGTVGTYFSAASDPSNPGSDWKIIGALNLDVSNADIINADFELGDTRGWTKSGDGRVISQLGSSTADGKFMGLVSTGLGFTLETGTLEQTFCIPDGKAEVKMSWKFFSEEFKEFCGSQYQDTFQAELVGADGKLTIVDVKVDDLCGYEDGSCGSCNNPAPCDIECAGTAGCQLTDTGCTGTYNCDCGKYFVGLTPSEVSFDQGGVFNVIWQRTVKNIESLAGTGPVTMRLFATDTGDSVFDTAILFDSIEFK